MSRPLLLCYHAVSERWTSPLAIGPEHLRGHVEMLRDRGYRGATFSDAVGEPDDGRVVAITFDDAYRSTIDLALPILGELGFPGTVFAPTAFMGSEKPMSWPGIDHWLESEHRDELVPMSWEELEALAEAGWEIGSHTRTHPRLPGLDRSALDAELAESRAEIERRLGACRALSYPYGAHDAGVVEAARRAGYAAAAGTLPGRYRPPSGALDWPRFVVVRGDDARRLRIKTSLITRAIKSTAAWDLVAAARRARRGRPAGRARAAS